MTRAQTERWEGKWQAHDAARRRETPQPDGKEERTPIIPAGKAWILRWAWLISTGMLVLGAGLIVVILSGQGHHIGL